MKKELTVRAAHEGGMRVRATNGAFHLVMDYPMNVEDDAAGPTPLTVLLESLAACSVNSVMLVLKKMQQPVSELEVEVRALRRTEHPTVLTSISLEFAVKGEGVDPAAVTRALQISEDRLCPIWNMLKGGTAIKAGFHLEPSVEPEAAKAR
jgi:putative redox protein